MNAHEQQLVNALRGPVIMITVGALFLLDNLTPLQFQQTWPILLIVVGVLALAGGTRRSRGLYRPGIPPQPTDFRPGTFPPSGFPAETFPDASAFPNGEKRTGEYRQ